MTNCTFSLLNQKRMMIAHDSGHLTGTNEMQRRVRVSDVQSLNVSCARFTSWPSGHHSAKTGIPVGRGLLLLPRKKFSSICIPIAWLPRASHNLRRGRAKSQMDHASGDASNRGSLVTCVTLGPRDV